MPLAGLQGCSLQQEASPFTCTPFLMVRSSFCEEVVFTSGLDEALSNLL